MTDNIAVEPSIGATAVDVATKDVDSVHYPIYASGVVSTGNSTTTLLTDTSVFTGEWEDVGHFNNVVVAVKTDQDGTYTVQFSPDGTNADSTLTRYYRTGQIEPPHKFTITRRYCRIVFTNNSGSDQTYLRLQTIFGDKGDLNAPLDSVMAQDFDAIATRPSDYHSEVATGRRQGSMLWNKFGYNADVDVGTEIVASWGGTYSINTVASTLSIVSSDAADDDGSTGCNSIVIYGVDANWNDVTEVVTMDGTTPVVTSSTWIGVNRVAMFLCGTGQTNAGLISVTKVTGSVTAAQMPAGEGVTQQCLFYVPVSHDFVAQWLLLGAAKQAAQNPYVTFKMWVYSAVNNGKQEVFRFSIDTANSSGQSVEPNLPFPITEKSIVWIEATTDKADTEVTARFSGELIKHVDN